jgi:hypothetical protein
VNLVCRLRGGEISINSQPDDPAEVSDDPRYFNPNLVLVHTKLEDINAQRWPRRWWSYNDVLGVLSRRFACGAAR